MSIVFLWYRWLLPWYTNYEFLGGKGFIRELCLKEFKNLNFVNKMILSLVWNDCNTNSFTMKVWWERDCIFLLQAEDVKVLISILGLTLIFKFQRILTLTLLFWKSYLFLGIIVTMKNNFEFIMYRYYSKLRNHYRVTNWFLKWNTSWFQN